MGANTPCFPYYTCSEWITEEDLTSVSRRRQRRWNFISDGLGFLAVAFLVWRRIWDILLERRRLGVLLEHVFLSFLGELTGLRDGESISGFWSVILYVGYLRWVLYVGQGRRRPVLITCRKPGTGWSKRTEVCHSPSLGKWKISIFI